MISFIEWLVFWRDFWGLLFVSRNPSPFQPHFISLEVILFILLSLNCLFCWLIIMDCFLVINFLILESNQHSNCCSISYWIVEFLSKCGSIQSNVSFGVLEKCRTTSRRTTSQTIRGLVMIFKRKKCEDLKTFLYLHWNEMKNDVDIPNILDCHSLEFEGKTIVLIE